MNDVFVVFVSCESRDQAETIAARLVEERLAACVNVLPGVRSCYVWQTKLNWAEEVLLVVKSTRDSFDALQARVRELHSYEVPEIIGLPVVAGFEKYLGWVRDSVR